MQFTCPRCQRTFSIPAVPASRELYCPLCGGIVLSPGGDAARPSIPVPPVPSVADPVKDRGSNRAGAAGLALGLTTLLFVGSAMAARKELPVYLGIASCCGLPMGLGGLILSIIGLARPGRWRWLALLGTLIGGFVVVAVLPAALLALKKGN